MSKVIFIPQNKLEKLPEAMKSFDLERFGGKTVLVKLHMGERGNKTHVNPDIVKSVCDEIAKIKAKPFLFDTLPAYAGGRDTKEKYMQTARMNGFGKIGYPIVISNEGTIVKMNGYGNNCGFDVANEIINAKHIVAISHVKGHIITAIGGAIKNFGMGGLTSRGKQFIHDGGKPKLHKMKCKLCGKCEVACVSEEYYPTKGIKVSKDVKDVELIPENCLGCGRCIKACPYEALVFNIDDFNNLLSIGAKACVQRKTLLYVNVALNITKHCDCASNSLPIICKDVGILLSNDPVAIDTASVDLVEERMGKTWKDVWGVDPMDHIKYAEKIGMGSTDYVLSKMS